MLSDVCDDRRLGCKSRSQDHDLCGWLRDLVDKGFDSLTNVLLERQKKDNMMSLKLIFFRKQTIIILRKQIKKGHADGFEWGPHFTFVYPMLFFKGGGGKPPTSHVFC